MKLYLNERKKRIIREMMQQGYMEMAKINQNIDQRPLRQKKKRIIR